MQNKYFNPYTISLAQNKYWIIEKEMGDQRDNQGLMYTQLT